MFEFLADFEWFRNSKGYRIVPARLLMDRSQQLTESADEGDLITPNGKVENEIRYKPFARGGDLFAAFASIRSPHQLLGFIKTHGPLTWRGNAGLNNLNLAHLPAGEPVTLGLAEAGTFRELLKLQSLGDAKRTALYFDKAFGFVQAGRVEILPDLQRGIRLKLAPPTLLGAMWYQLALKLSESVLRMCPVCHRVFEVGRGTKLRADATFCCNKHKVQFFNQRRAKKRQDAQRGI